jgi:hypothetical protein
MGLVNMLMWFVINLLRDLIAQLQVVTLLSRAARRSGRVHRFIRPHQPCDRSCRSCEPSENPADSLEESASASFSGFSGSVFIEFHSDLDGCRVMKTCDGGYMHVTTSPVADGKLPQARVATGEL